MVMNSSKQVNLPESAAAQTVNTDIPQSFPLSDERSFTTYTYGTEHALQTYDVWSPQQAPPPAGEGIWIIYIHGGAWRDPRQDSKTVRPAIEKLIEKSLSGAAGSLLHRVIGIASINYGLSPHPDFPPQHVTEGQSDSRQRNSQENIHPDHIQDVQKALAHLHQNHSIGTPGYLICGHSCGATLAFQSLMRDWFGPNVKYPPEYPKPHSTDTQERATEQSPFLSVTPPRAVIGLEGIYDIPEFVSFHEAEPYYLNFVKGALGSDLSVWADASTTNGTYKSLELAILGHSPNDEYVEQQQTDLMAASLCKQQFQQFFKPSDSDSPNSTSARSLSQISASQRAKCLLELKLKGKHDEIWSEGVELARVFEVALAKIFNEDLSSYSDLGLSSVA